MFRKITTVLLSVLLCSCATTKFTKLPVGPLKYKQYHSIDINLPIINNVMVSNVGDNIIIKTPSYQKEAIHLKSEITHTGVNLERNFKLRLPEGTYYLEGEDYRGKFFRALTPLQFSVGSSSVSVIGGIVISHSADNSHQIYWQPTDMLINRISDPLTQKIDYSKTVYEESIKDELHSRIIYKGISDNQVKFVYKEFINDMARPAFNMDISYDYKPGVEVGFRNSRFTILRASSTEIEYKVNRHF